ncbi:GAF and ANTAR domain-containing protein [Nocardioides sp. LMS-CY]|uniref:GAF and ANTAR domain-containing protein n=1 Tax=Nocardioides sp. (strain LMS-CY) TaxID=2840457 RepID=UPI001C007FF9|nr:GAF and ANTAR domain-containing protein [Nocardioides sp. LMS-CY]QWF20206.1 GAF and ANTAR domain-containing protein [Nocardioides sp. LMS-CY]
MRTELNAAMAAAAPGISAANELCVTCVGLFGIDGAAVSMVYEGASRGTFGASSETGRRLDEYQFTFGEGPCLDAVEAREMVLAPDLDSPREQRWPLFADAVLDDGIRGVFAFPVMITSACVGALDLFRAEPGPLSPDQISGAMLAAELASKPLLDLVAGAGHPDLDELGGAGAGAGAGSGDLAEVNRIEVYQATGMLIAQLDVDAAEALVRLRAHAMATGQTAIEVALAIVQRRLVLDRDDHDDHDDEGDDGGPARRLS